MPNVQKPVARPECVMLCKVYMLKLSNRDKHGGCTHIIDLIHRCLHYPHTRKTVHFRELAIPGSSGTPKPGKVTVTCAVL